MSDLSKLRAGKAIKGTGKPDVVDEEEQKRKRDAEYQKTLPPEATGLGGGAWRAGVAGKKHREDWEKKNPINGWGR